MTRLKHSKGYGVERGLGVKREQTGSSGCERITSSRRSGKIGGQKFQHTYPMKLRTKTISLLGRAAAGDVGDDPLAHRANGAFQLRQDFQR
jgi:hypothetical protein